MTAPPRVVLVTGAAGFIGREVVAKLLEAGWHVRAMARGARTETLTDVPDNLSHVRGDMRDERSLLEAVRGCSAVVHLAAAKADETDSDEVNVGGARRLIAACQAAGCERLINVSTQSVKILRQGVYARTKSEADRIFKGSGLRITTLMPSVVYGQATLGVFGTITKMVRKLPVIPILGDGKWLSAPVYVGDVSTAIVACLQQDSTIGRSYDIGGPGLLTFDHLVDCIADAVGQRKPKFHVPLGISLLAARVLAWIPGSPITVSNVLGSNQDTFIDIGPARADFAFDPIDLACGLTKVFGGVAQSAADDWTQDAQMIGRYLIGSSPSPADIARYRDAAAARHADDDAADARWHWIRRHPWALASLDAASALFERRSSVRQRIYLMAAILETSPVHAEFYLRPSHGRLRLVVDLAWQAASAALKVCLGILLLIWTKRR